MWMLDRRVAYGLEPELFVHLVERLDRIRDQQLGPARENEQPRRVRHHLHQPLALVVRVDHHPAELEHFRRVQAFEQLRRIQMTECEWRIREASRPERTNQRGTPALAALPYRVQAEMNRQRPQQYVNALFLHVQHLPRPLVERSEFAQTHRSADR